MIKKINYMQLQIINSYLDRLDYFDVKKEDRLDCYYYLKFIFVLSDIITS